MKKVIVGSLTVAGCLLSASATSYADTSTATSFGNPVATVLKLFLFLAIIIVLAVLTIRFLAKKSQVVQKGGIQVLAARQVAPNRSVQVIDVDGKRFLIGVGDQVTLLAEVETADGDIDLDEAVDEPRSFGKTLADALRAVRSQYAPSSKEEESGL